MKKIYKVNLYLQNRLWITLHKLWLLKIQSILFKPKERKYIFYIKLWCSVIVNLLFRRWTFHFLKSGPDSGSFVCEGGLSEPTEPCSYGPVTINFVDGSVTKLKLHILCDWIFDSLFKIFHLFWILIILYKKIRKLRFSESRNLEWIRKHSECCTPFLYISDPSNSVQR